MTNPRTTAVALLAVLGLGASTPAITLACEGASEGTLQANPLSLDFGKVRVGSTATLSDTVKALFAPVTITKIVPLNSVFRVTTDKCSLLTLPTNGECEIQVTFEPLLEGEQNGSDNITQGSGSFLGLSLKGSGENAVGIAPGTLKWKPTEKTVKEFTLTTITKIVIKSMKTNDGTDFTVLQVAGCKVNMTVTATSPCKAEVKRLTEAKPGQKIFEWTYEDEDGTIEKGREGVLEAE